METLTVTKTIIDNRPLTVAEEWIVDEIVLFVENTEKFYLGLVAKCNMAMADLEKGKYKESRQIENVMYVVDSAVAEYRRTIGKGKFSELNGKVQRRNQVSCSRGALQQCDGRAWLYREDSW
jgi:hypothetical protein